MNNEPVAWMSEFGQFIGKVQDEICHIPLYTHPHSEESVKEKTQEPDLYSEDGFPLWTSPQLKTLTDEEIWQTIIEECGDFYNRNQDVYELCKAILRKAQEK